MSVKKSLLCKVIFFKLNSTANIQHVLFRFFIVYTDFPILKYISHVGLFTVSPTIYILFIYYYFFFLFELCFSYMNVYNWCICPIDYIQTSSSNVKGMICYLFICIKKWNKEKIKKFISAAPFYFYYSCVKKKTTWNKSKHRFPIKLVRHIKNWINFFYQKKKKPLLFYNWMVLFTSLKMTIFILNRYTCFFMVKEEDVF